MSTGFLISLAVVIVAVVLVPILLGWVVVEFLRFRRDSRTGRTSSVSH